MADISAVPLTNYGPLLTSYGQGIADTQLAQNQAGVAGAQIPLIQQQTAQAQLNNQIARLRMQAMQQFVQQPPAANPAPTSDAQQPGATPAANADDSGPFNEANESANMDQAFSSRFRVFKGYTPDEASNIQRATGLSALTGDDAYVKLAQQQHDMRVQTETAQKQAAAQQASDSAYGLATVDGPPGTAFALLERQSPQQAEKLKAAAEENDWTPAELDAHVQKYATMANNKLFQYTGDQLLDKNGETVNSRTGNKLIGTQTQGVAPNVIAETSERAGAALLEPVSVPQSDGSTVTVPRWKADGYPSLAAARAAVTSTAGGAPSPLLRNAPGTSSTAPGAPAPANAAAAAGDQALSKALADTDYRLQMPKVTTGVSMSEDAKQKLTAANTARAELLKDSGDATAAAAQSLQYLQAAKAIIQSKGAATGAYGALIAKASSLLGTDSPDAANYQELAKYLGNAALANAKGIYGSRMTQSEVGLQLNELSPSVHMQDPTINNLLDTNIRSAQYTINSARRVNSYLRAGNDPQQFNEWNEKYYPRGEIVNQAPTASKPMPTGAKLNAYAAAHFGGDAAKAQQYLQSQGYK